MTGILQANVRAVDQAKPITAASAACIGTHWHAGYCIGAYPDGMTNVMEVPEGVADALAAADMSNADLALAMTEALASTRVWSAVPDADLDLMLTESGLGADGQQQVRDGWEAPAKASVAEVTNTLAAQSLADDRLTTREVAARIGVSPSTVTRRVERRELLAIRDSRGRLLLPAWQFARADALPGWHEVAPALAGIDLRTVEAFLGVEQDELDGVSALTWLGAGRDPQPVTALAQTVTSW